MSKSRLADLLSLADVKRWNSRARFLREQSVAEHTFNVMAIAFELIMEMRPCIAATTDGARKIVLDALCWGLVHDGPECETGDINYLFKRNLSKVAIKGLEVELCPWYDHFDRTTPDMAKAIVKIADKIEEYLYLKNWGAKGTMEEFGPGVLQQIQTHCYNAIAAYGWQNLTSTVCGIIDTYIVVGAGAAVTPPLPSPLPQAQST